MALLSWLHAWTRTVALRSVLAAGLRLVQVLFVALALLVVPALHADSVAKDKPAAAKQVTLPEPLTKESIRELVSRLDDAEVRKLLIQQLDRAAAPKGAQPEKALGVVETLQQQAGDVRDRTLAIAESTLTVPETIATVVDALAAGEGELGLLKVAFGLVAMLAIGYVAEYAFLRLLRGVRARLASPPEGGVLAYAAWLARRLALLLGAIAAFAAAALTLFFLAWQGNEVRRAFVLSVLVAIVVVRVTRQVSRFLLAPRDARARLLPLADATALTMHRALVAIASIGAAEFAAYEVFHAAGVPRAAKDLLLVVAIVLVLAIVLWTIWAVRPAVNASMHASRERGPLASLAIDFWPLALTLYVLVVFGTRLLEIATGQFGDFGAGALSLLLLVALPIVDWALCRALDVSTAGVAGSAGTASLIKAYEPVLRRAVHIVVLVAGLLALAAIWDVDMFDLAQRGLGSRIAGSLLGMAIVVMLAWMAWEVAKTAIDRRLQAEGDTAGAASRIRTLLPIARVALQITIFVMALMSVLAALGVDILPLLAGASVVGVAIGFGSQALVRDIVSGAFFLMDDAFRVGEYIEVGDAKGTIEKITVRSLFLRHHRGALNILPYGEIKRLRNTSRDWIIIVMEFRLAFDTDLKKVKKLVKQIGDDLAQDPEVGPDLLQTLKSQGVTATDESSLVLRCKYMAKPGTNAFVIRRMAYERILKAFHEAGIRFAGRQVSVYVPPGTDADEAKQAAVAAAASAALDDKGRAAA